MASAAVRPPPSPERRVPVVADDGGGGGGHGPAKGEDSGSSGSVAGISPSIVIIAVIVVVMLLASVTIHYFIRHLCRHARGASLSAASASSGPALPVVVRPAAAAADLGKPSAEAAAEMERLISRMPLFTLASSLAAVPKSSRDCAVCQSAFRDDDELRLLPACRHAFHSRCVDPWLRANPSCPLCRASIALPHPPLPELLRIELGSVSSRRSNSAAAVAAAPLEGAPVRAYPLPSLPNSEYLVEEDLQVVIKQPSAAPPRTGEPSQHLPQQQQVAAVERGQLSSVTPTASFSSARSQERWSNRWSNRWSSRWSSGRWSTRYDAGNVTAAATAEWWWDMDGGAAPAAPRREAEEQGSAFYGFVRWLTGAY